MADSASLLSPTQRKIVGFALALAASLLIVLLLALLVFGLSRALGFFSSVLWPLAVAGIVALILQPVVGLLERRLRVGRLTAVVSLYAVFVFSLAGVLVALAPVVVAQTADFAQTVPKLWEQASGYAQTHYPEWIAYGREQMQNPTVKQFVDRAAAQLQGLFAGLLPGVLSALEQIRGAVGFLVGLALVPVYLFFFLRSTGDVFAQLRGLLPFLRDDLRDDVVFLVREFVGIVVAFFRGQLLIGLIMGTIYATGFSIAGLKFGLVIGLGMGLLNVIPYLGTMLGLSVALPLAFFQPEGGLWLVGAVLGVFAAVQALEGWFLTPRIMGQQTGLHPVAIIVAILFWGTALDGLLGMVLAIPLTAFFVTAWRLAKHKYLETPAAAPPLAG
ncbi:MAG TPA: AI-2E family transporter [Opitutaceae bacterium]|nr:AI-2E family transporter [Opitutaceae bacterium]